MSGSAKRLLQDHQDGHLLRDNLASFGNGLPHRAGALSDADHYDLLAPDDAVSRRTVNSLGQHAVAPSIDEHFLNSERFDQFFRAHGCFFPCQRLREQKNTSGKTCKLNVRTMHSRVQVVPNWNSGEETNAADTSQREPSQHETTRVADHAVRGGVFPEGRPAPQKYSGHHTGADAVAALISIAGAATLIQRGL